MQLFLRSLGGKNLVLVSLNGGDSISTLHERVEELEGVPAHYQVCSC